MNSLLKLSSSLIFILFLNSDSQAQELLEQNAGLRKNTVGISLGTVVTYVNANIYYERLFPLKKLSPAIHGFGRLSAGQAGSILGGGANHFSFQSGAIIGQSKHHLELAAGPMFWDTSSNNDPDENSFYRIESLSEYQIRLSGNIGWRYQKPEGHLMLRSGLGWPEAIYVGIGAAF